MIYVLLLIGFAFIFLGWKMKGKKTIQDGEVFKEMIHHQENDRGEYIEILSLNQEIKGFLAHMDEKLDGILANISRKESEDQQDQQEQQEQQQQEQQEIQNFSPQNYSKAIQTIEKMVHENKSIDEISETLNIPKGEVLLLKRLFTK